MLSRTALIRNLERVEPALSDNPMIPVLSHFWFTGKSLLAYNGAIAISVPCETEFVGAVPKTLLAMLRTSGAKEIEITEKNGSLEVKAAAARWKLPTLPPDDFTFKMKAFPNDPFEVDAPAFMSALRECMRSLGKDTSRPDFAGVTVIPRKKSLWLFSFDRVTVSHGAAKGKMFNEERAILPTAWCQQALSIAEKAEEIDLEINEDFALLRYDEIKLFAHLVQPESPMDFAGKIVPQIPEFDTGINFEEFREKFKAVLERAKIVTSGGIARTRTAIVIEDGKMHLTSKSEAGEAFDTCLMEGHPNVEANVDPTRLLDGIEFDVVSVGAETVVFQKDGGRLVYLVSSGGGDE